MKNLDLVKIEHPKGDLALWDHNKKKEFVDIVKTRIGDAIRVLNIVRVDFAEEARKRYYLHQNYNNDQNDIQSEERYSIYLSNKDNGLTWTEIQEIAKVHTKALIANLPQSINIIEVIKPEIAKLMKEQSVLLKKKKALTLKISEIPCEFNYNDFDPKTTIADVRKQILQNTKDRNKFILEINEICSEMDHNRDTINKSLYKGIPELQKASVDIINSIGEQIKEHQQFGRRLEEKILFGDSEAAMDILSTFEKNECKINIDIKAKIDEAINKLKTKSIAETKGKKKTTKKLNKK